jgi:REP element-mobilizing transposase RayT
LSKRKRFNHIWVLYNEHHVHAILQSSKGELSKTIGEYKSYCAKTILKAIANQPESRQDWMLKRFEFAAQGSNNNKDFKFWRDGNHPEEIYSEDFFWNKLNYIHMNPVRAGIVCYAHHYLHCSASNYI